MLSVRVKRPSVRVASVVFAPILDQPFDALTLSRNNGSPVDGMAKSHVSFALFHLRAPQM
jgi:hypothetical protein